MTAGCSKVCICGDICSCCSCGCCCGSKNRSGFVSGIACRLIAACRLIMLLTLTGSLCTSASCTVWAGKRVSETAGLSCFSSSTVVFKLEQGISLKLGMPVGPIETIKQKEQLAIHG